jgi:hypothetical protein
LIYIQNSQILFFGFFKNLGGCELTSQRISLKFVDIVGSRSMQGRATEKSEIRNLGAGSSANKKQIINQI